MTGRGEPVWPPWLPKRLLTIDEAAALLRVSPRTVRRLIADGSVEVVRIGRSVRLRPEKLAALIDGK